jgi:membrane-associated phospholipid phosphatase
VGLFSTDNIAPLAIGAAATGLSIVPEQNVETYFLANPESAERIAEPGEFIGNAELVAPVVAGLFAAGLYRDGDPRFKATTYALAQGFVVNGVVTAGMKAGFSRMRPDGSNDVSFPSGHTSMSFMWATVLSRNYGLKVGIPAYAVAGYVGATRLQENKHHMSDIVAGATIGYIVGRTVTRHRKGGRLSKVNWMVAPARRGFVASLSFPGP